MPEANLPAANRLQTMHNAGRILFYVGTSCVLAIWLLRRLLAPELMTEPGAARNAVAIFGLIAAACSITGLVIIWRTDRAE
jgi:hypothetical protein